MKIINIIYKYLQEIFLKFEFLTNKQKIGAFVCFFIFGTIILPNLLVYAILFFALARFMNKGFFRLILIIFFVFLFLISFFGLFFFKPEDENSEVINIEPIETVIKEVEIIEPAKMIVSDLDNGEDFMITNKETIPTSIEIEKIEEDEEIKIIIIIPLDEPILNIPDTNVMNAVAELGIQKNIEITQDKSETSDSVSQIQEIPKTEYKVISVVDGDTVEINMNGTIETIRLIGIDTPETVHPSKPVECMGIEASNKTKELLLDQTVSFKNDETQDTRDRFNRLLGYLFLPDGSNYGEVMIRSGFAIEYTYSNAYTYQSVFKEAEQIARDEKIGLWADDICDESVDEQPSTESQSMDIPTANGEKWYVSSHHSSRYYYCEDTDAWEGLSESYLEIYNSEAELKAQSRYTNHTLHESCR